MPPKKTAAAKKKAEAAEGKRKAAPAKGRGGKKKKQEEEDEEEEEEEVQPVSEARKMIDALKKVDNKKRVCKVDTLCGLANRGGIVLDDYDCMLNQTNIGQNNNKYYVIQVIQAGGKYYSWNRWGRVGEPGQNALKGPFNDSSKAIDDFEKKFKDKTKNKWEDRDSFEPVPGKYTLIEMGDEEEEEPKSTTTIAKAVKNDSPKVTLPCKLDKATQSFIELIFNNDMFSHAMQQMDIDTKKMPLGKISKAQIAKGFEVLEQLEAALNGNRTYGTFEELSSRFYTVIPHSFGRQRPPPIDSGEALRKKMDMLTVLSDIEVAQAMQNDNKVDTTQSTVPHPLDVQYGLLSCDLTPLDTKSEKFKVLEKYLRATECSSYRKITILDIFEVNRRSEGERFSAHEKVENRRLLWHGTNVAVVAAILQSGLRIMPHSGGRVGKGIYFASENSKSAGYVCPAAGGQAIMFLNEVVLGNIHNITQDDHTLRTAPKGFHSIVARGWTEPDPKQDTALMLDGHKVVVPQGKPIKQSEYSSSSFSQSEYLIYREDQCRIRFVLKLKFG